ncbi:MAG: DUF86 domain-containing protein [Sulfurovum sp.]|nr:MAG: DUF86 domain-containing protein [Sulfurovum sp.]
MSNTELAFKTILLSIEKILLYSSSSSDADDFYHDSKSFDATMIHFINLGEMIERIDEDTKKHYSSIPYQEIKDFRNLVAHNYFGIDAEEIWDIIHNHLPTLKVNIIKILKNMDN